MKCYNTRCTNELPINRQNKKTYQISNWWFCVQCLKNRTIVPLTYPCGRDDCNNILSFGQSTRKYCSVICKRRNMLKVGLPHEKNCLACNEVFITKMGYPQKFCSSICRAKHGQKRKNYLKRLRYKTNNKGFASV